MIHVDIGFRYYGKTSALGPEAVYTRYLVIGLPLVAMDCWYGKQRGRRHEHDLAARRIRRHLPSVILGYARWYAILPEIIVFVTASPSRARPGWDFPLLALAILLGAMHLAILFLFVKASPRYASQRQLLGKIVKSTADPGWLRRSECQTVIDGLEPVFDSLSIPIDLLHWESRTPEPELAPFVFAMARYQAQIEQKRRWMEVSRRAWNVIQAHSVTTRQNSFEPV